MTRSLFVALALMPFVGCSEKAPFNIVPVTGKVTYDDGSPIPGKTVEVRFLSQVAAASAKEHPRPASAILKPDGSFSEMTTWKYADGAIVGQHKVIVNSKDEREQPTKAVPNEYRDAAKTPLTVEVVAGGPPLEIKIPKPAK